MPRLTPFVILPEDLNSIATNYTTLYSLVMFQIHEPRQAGQVDNCKVDLLLLRIFLPFLDGRALARC